MFNIGDYVTRNSYNNDVVFKIISIDEDLYYLKGVNVRLYADSYKEDLKLYNDGSDSNDSFLPSIEEYRKLNRSEYFYLPGKILHLDGDKEYLDSCLDFYKKNKLRAYGVYFKEEELASNIVPLLEKYTPDIVVITGHDAYYRKRKNGSKYKNTSNFVECVKMARTYEKSHQKLIIIAGACQSDYEELIKAGANFASSPKRINIHALDPAIVAGCMAFSDINNNIDLINILEKTKYGSAGMGGIITKGTMYTGYPRE